MKKKTNKSLVIVSNDKFKYKNQFLFYENKNTQTIIDGVLQKYNIFLLARKNSKNLILKKKINNVKIISFFDLFKFFKKGEVNFFFISITPYNFFVFLTLKFFFIKKKKYNHFFKKRWV